MYLPRANRATIHPSKILRYLLDPTNPASSGKPALFFALGYIRRAWGVLNDDLVEHGRTHPVTSVAQSQDEIA
ncbi:MAG: DUF6883 domain-containing protein, partial [Thermomicrobiales bacterium]